MPPRKESTGRPSKGQTRATERPRQRVGVGGYRDKLTVEGQDPDYVYRWILSGAEKSGRILNLRARGYEFVKAEDHNFGESDVYKSQDEGSLVRTPAGKEGDFLYLMRIRKEHYEEDKEDKSKRILDEHEAVRNYAKQDGVYGKFELK